MANLDIKNLDNLSKEQLIKIITDWELVHSRMSYYCVQESKMHIDSSRAISEIVECLKDICRYNLLDEHLGDYVDMQLGKISGKEYRERVLGMDDEDD